MNAPLLSAEGLEKRFSIRRSALDFAFGIPEGYLPALRGVGFRIAPGETLGLVGESGSGKTTAGRIVARLLEPDAGRIEFGGTDWLALRGAELRRRRRELQIVFQDPQSSLNPRMQVGDQIGEPLRVQGLARGRDLRERVGGLLSEVGLPPALASRYPAELSGGQRQRVAIARALATRPRLVVCDEPVSALDVSIAAQIVNLLLELRERAGLSYLFISHDVAVVARVADRIAVFYLGRVVEEGPSREVTGRPLHPYTAALVSAAPDPDPLGGVGGSCSRRGRPTAVTRPPDARSILGARLRGTAAARSGPRSWRSLRRGQWRAFTPANCRDMRT